MASGKDRNRIPPAGRRGRAGLESETAMTDLVHIDPTGTGIPEDRLSSLLDQAIADVRPALRKVLLVPPDYTRAHSGAGRITAHYCAALKDTCQVDILPALGTHEPMTEAECRAFFGPDVPFDRVLPHRWRTDVETLGEVPGSFVAEVSEGLMSDPIPVQVNRRLLDPSYDLVLSIGQVVPHEVVGMANYSKNVFVGCGGSAMINASHMLGAFYGMERIMGRDRTPVRQVFDYAEAHFTGRIPLRYILTVTTAPAGVVRIHGLFAGRSRRLFEEAVRLSQARNLTLLPRPLRKAVVYLDEAEFKSTWLGNKAIYRTRMALADGGALLVLAPGVRKFGEDDRNDALIRKYGYVGRERVLALCRTERDLQENLSVAAHLIHGSSDGRFSIAYAPGRLTREETEGVGFRYAALDEALRRYDPARLRDGFQVLPDGEEIFYIRNPALGLWAFRDRFPDAPAGGTDTPAGEPGGAAAEGSSR